MEIKLRANIVMSKELTIEANDWSEAVDKAQAMMAEPIPYKELTPTKLYFRRTNSSPACRCGITRCFRSSRHWTWCARIRRG